MADKPTLVYFDFDGGRGEHIRLAFHIGGVDFNDERITFPQFKTEWKDSGKAPYGSLPVLLVGDKVFAQSNAILRYAAQVGNAHLYPSNPLNALLVDQLCDAFNELGAAAPQDPDPAEKKKKREEWAKDGGQLHTALARLESQVGANFSVGDHLTIADLTAYSTIKGVVSGSWDFVPTNSFDRYPNLSNIYKVVKEHPKVAEWYQIRESKKTQ